MEQPYHEKTAERKPEVELIATADYQRELSKLSDIAFVFLNAAGADPTEAEKLLDEFVDLILEGGILSTWRYRILLAQIRGGL